MNGRAPQIVTAGSSVEAVAVAGLWHQVVNGILECGVEGMVGSRAFLVRPERPQEHAYAGYGFCTKGCWRP